MTSYLLLIGIVIMICILSSRMIEKIAVPSLLIFIALGMCFGENGIFRISFDNYVISDIICSVSLIFIMFYGGFGTNLSAAKPVAAKAVLMSTLGVVFTAGIVGLMVHYCLRIDWPESLLIGSVISSTDAASVFNILRSKKLSLKDHTDSLLELESGSNDPISYMLTVTMITIMTGEQISIPLMLFKQVFFGLLCGVLMGKLAVFILTRVSFHADHEKTVFVFSVAVISYTLPAVLGGNGYLAVYLCGIIMGNSYIPQKRYLVHFFDVLTNVAQVIIFFLLGLLVTPSNLPEVLLPALFIMAVMTFIARPLVTVLLLKPFRSSMAQIGIVSWAGLRGVASIVFAILALLSNIKMQYNLFNLVFCIVLLSISFQGTLLPWISKRMNMIDHSSDVNKTFTDYQEESDINFIKIHVTENHPWLGKTLRRIGFPQDILAVMIARKGENIVPNGSTVIEAGDLVVFAAREFEDRENLSLHEVAIDKGHKWNNKKIGELIIPEQTLIIMVQRGNETIIPNGDTLLCEKDMLVVAQPETFLQ